MTVLIVTCEDRSFAESGARLVVFPHSQKGIKCTVAKFMSPSTVAVHRCRFVDHTPTAITAIAIPPLPLPRVKGKGKETGTYLPNFGTFAVGRANGNIELLEWTGMDRQTQAPQGWVAKKILPGPVPSKVESLVFALGPSKSDFPCVPHLKDLRLFSTGGGSEILEWDLERGSIIRSISSQGGSVWSMAANPSSTLLALGCEDGSVRIISLADNSLTPHRRLDRVKSRLLSIAWGPPVRKLVPRREAGGESSSEEDEGNGWADSWIVAGCSDSSLRKFDVSSGRVLDRMTTDKARGERTLVWAIGVLGDGTIVSGDSLGTVKFWDSNTCTQLQSFQTHGADVLCLTIGPEGKSVYTSGVDQKVCQFSNVPVATATGNVPSSSSFHSKWVHTCSRRLHSHDVRCISTWPPYAPLTPSHRPPALSPGITPMLVSGGLDMSLVICPCALPSPDSNMVNPLKSGFVSTFEDGYHLRLPYTTGMSPAVQVSREAKLLLCRRNTNLTIWKIKQSVSPEEVGLTDIEVPVKDQGDNWEKLVDMELKTRTNLVASAIADDGSWVAASDLYETKLFRLIHAKNEVRPKRAKLADATDVTTTGATSLLFTSDSSKLIVGACMGSSLVMVVDLKGEGNDSPRVLRTFEQHRMQNVIVGTSRAVSNLQSSFDANGEMPHHSGDDSSEETGEISGFRSSNALAVASTIICMAASMDGQWLASADTRNRVHVFNLDSVQHHCALPSFPHAIAALSFDPGSPAILIIGLVNNTLQVFDVEARQFPELSHALSQVSSSPFSHLHDPLLGITFDPGVVVSGIDAAVGRRVLLWGSSWMCKVKLAAPSEPGSTSKKRRRESRRLSTVAVTQKGIDTSLIIQNAEDDPNFHLVTRYRPLLLVDYLGPGELLVVERPLIDLLNTLPPAYYKATYGS